MCFDFFVQINKSKMYLYIYHKVLIKIIIKLAMIEHIYGSLFSF